MAGYVFTMRSGESQMAPDNDAGGEGGALDPEPGTCNVVTVRILIGR